MTELMLTKLVCSMNNRGRYNAETKNKEHRDQTLRKRICLGQIVKIDILLEVWRLKCGKRLKMDFVFEICSSNNLLLEFGSFFALVSNEIFGRFLPFFD